MAPTFYTLGVWRVKPQHEDEFIAAWKTLSVIFSQLSAPPIGKGTLLQSVTEPTLFYSFGPWQSLEDVQAMRQTPRRRLASTVCASYAPKLFQGVSGS